MLCMINILIFIWINIPHFNNFLLWINFHKILIFNTIFKQIHAKLHKKCLKYCKKKYNIFHGIQNKCAF